MIKDLPGVRPVFFFAPDRIKARLADWGPKSSLNVWAAHRRLSSRTRSAG